MRNLKITIAFCGTNYHGFQVQKNVLTVCEAFQDAAERILGQRYDVKGCSRTDTGVHANEYVLSMKCDTQIRADKLVLALNRYLPEDIAALSVMDAPDDFHARYDCIGKEYVYRLRNSRVKDPFSPNLSYRFGYPLDVDMLNREAADFVGQHDFVAFQSAGSDIEDTVRTVNSFTVHREGDYVLFTVQGDGFLYNMVRIMVGTLLFIGIGKLPEGNIPAIIESKDRSRAGKTMPALGLFLNRVFY
jgi:tRNA pseudouridine38-40 synthase